LFKIILASGKATANYVFGNMMATLFYPLRYSGNGFFGAR
jgi:hypothetical protein